MEPVRIGLAGCGLFGESHLQAFRAVGAAVVAAVFDVDRVRSEELASAFGIPKVCESLEELCAEDVDAIDVVTPEASHLATALAAVSSGKHVFIEKPLAADLDDCSRMIQAAENGGRILMVGHILRFETRYALLKEEIASGRLGRIVSMQARRNRPKSALGRYSRTHPVLLTAIHDIDLMLWYSGDRVRRVRGYGRNITGNRHDDAFWGVLEFDGGALGIIETNWILPEASGVALDDAFRVVGDEGVGNLNFFPAELTFWRNSGFTAPDTSYDPRLRGAAHGALKDELEYFCECVSKGCAPRIVTPVEGKNAVRVALALIESARANREIEISDWG